MLRRGLGALVIIHTFETEEGETLHQTTIFLKPVFAKLCFHCGAP